MLFNIMELSLTQKYYIIEQIKFNYRKGYMDGVVSGVMVGIGIGICIFSVL